MACLTRSDIHRAVRNAGAMLAGLWLALGTAAPAVAIDLGTLVMPGKVIEGHADVETECSRCHRAFDSSAQDGLCLDCHPKVEGDFTAREGLHGRAVRGSASPCRTCHSDHLGRDADIVGLDPETFDHRRTDFALLGAHLRLGCSACHSDGHKHREAPSDCLSCHRRDDPHRSRLGEDCEKCHVATTWREARFDHSKLKFQLDGGHAGLDCALCHPAERYADTPIECNACHRLNDVHRGRFGTRCEQCHSSQSWTKAGFDHAKKTKFALLGKHQQLACKRCHTPLQPEAKLDMRCVSCHRADDDHEGALGGACDSCHRAEGWRRTTFDHRRDAKLALEGAHEKLPCAVCHQGVFQEKRKKRDCVACHIDDDAHHGQQGKRCGDCHQQRSWLTEVAFDHDVSSFPLLGLHAVAICEDCHEGATFRDTSERCVDCHRGRDVHEGRLASGCGLCHNPNGWRLWYFDHRRQTDYPLRGAHRDLNCLDCHRTAVRDKVQLSKNCESCHSLDDPHRGSFGARCDDCHRETRWKEVRLRR